MEDSRADLSSDAACAIHAMLAHFTDLQTTSGSVYNLQEKAAATMFFRYRYLGLC